MAAKMLPNLGSGAQKSCNNPKVTAGFFGKQP
jgi:hypothetical protein